MALDDPDKYPPFRAYVVRADGLVDTCFENKAGGIEWIKAPTVAELLDDTNKKPAGD